MKSNGNIKENGIKTALIFLVIAVFGGILGCIHALIRLLEGMYYDRAFAAPGVISAIMPDSLIAAQFICIFVFLFYALYIGLSFEKRRRLRLWTLLVPALAFAFLFPQMHGQIRLFEDGRLEVTDAAGEIQTAHGIEDVLRASVSVSGRMHHSKGGKTPGNVSLKLTYDFTGYHEAYSFSLDSFSGQTPSARLLQMLAVRRMIPSERVVISPYSEDAMQEAFEDQGLAPCDWAAVSYLFHPDAADPQR